MFLLDTTVSIWREPHRSSNEAECWKILNDEGIPLFIFGMKNVSPVTFVCLLLRPASITPEASEIHPHQKANEEKNAMSKCSWFSLKISPLSYSVYFHFLLMPVNSLFLWDVNSILRTETFNYETFVISSKYSLILFTRRGCTFRCRCRNPQNAFAIGTISISEVV